MNRTWTKEQQKVIDLRNRSILVSAAAGSGKTAVLVERLVSMITDPEDPADIDRLLVVTFTNAAASEMRERVTEAINQRLAADPQNHHLLRQLSLIHNAQITTIDSFCLNVVRSHFHAIGLEPGFRVAEEGELDLLKEDICRQMLDDCYQNEDPAFRTFADAYAGARGDDRVKEWILSLYNYSQSAPYPERWLAACKEQYEAGPEGSFDGKDWAGELCAYLENCVSEFLEQNEMLRDLAFSPNGPFAYGENLQDDKEQLLSLRQCDSLSAWQETLEHISFGKLKAVRAKDVNESLKDLVKDQRNAIKKEVESWRTKYFSRPYEELMETLSEAGKMVSVLLDLAIRFSREYLEAKTRRMMVDFSDIEHYALQILIDPETGQPTQIAAEYQEMFREVLIDEYQDSNYVQEMILTAVSRLSRGVENYFMVGDVKQSIYRFRLARPELFLEKQERFSTEDCLTQRVDLDRNFRSRPEVLDCVNACFEKLMRHDMGRIVYDDAAKLYQGKECEEDTGKRYLPEITILTGGAKSASEQLEAEAHFAAARIRRLLTEEQPELTWRDVVILMRSPSKCAQVYQQVFDEEGIPLSIQSQTGYFSAMEVRTILDFLKVIDNDRQDIPMAAVMRSYFGGFSSDEMAVIRAETEDPGIPFYGCVRSYAENGKNEALRSKTEQFLASLRRWQERIPYTPIHLLLKQIYDETGYYHYMSALPGGAQRQANLDMLIEQAIAYENTSFRGVYHFNRYIDQLHKYDVDYGEAGVTGETEDAVRIMSIHKSKGLEFPVVLLAGMGRKINKQDSSAAAVLHPEYGVGIRYIDPKTHVRTDTLIRQSLSVITERENMGEELRVLYVAMTRAEKKLILSGFYNREKSAFASLLCKHLGHVDFYSRIHASCYYDWVIPAVTADHPEWIRIWEEEDTEKENTDRIRRVKEEKARLTQMIADSGEDLTELSRRLEWTYPYTGKAAPRQKVSVSELKKRAMEEQADRFAEVQDDHLFPEEDIVPYVPLFISRTERENAGAQFGTDMHHFMQCADLKRFDPSCSEEERNAYIEAEIARMAAEGQFDEETAARLNRASLSRFFASDAAARMHEAELRKDLYREQPFVMGIDAKRAFPDSEAGQEILIQGIIDVFWEEEDGFVVLDYKTDAVRTADELIRRYRLQLQLYAEAVGRRFSGKKVKKILIYSFRLNKEIDVENG